MYGIFIIDELVAKMIDVQYIFSEKFWNYNLRMLIT